MGKPIAVIFLWHMHQPVYEDPLSGEVILPWVRLHAAKDYIDMARAVASVPNTKAVFNVVPCLMEQLVADRPDRFFELSRKPATELSEVERALLVGNFFSAHADHMIRPFPRYQFLFDKYLAHGASANPRSMPDDEARDLQVWFNLAWCGEHIAEEPAIAALIEKGRGFTEEEKLLLLERHRQCVREVLPYYRQLIESQVIEVSTTPFYHPILPLLINIDEALICRPGSSLPDEPFGYAIDAVSQVESAIDFYRQQFGRLPTGMWPAEGSVSEEALQLLVAGRIRWAATDEGILFSSLDGPPPEGATFRAYEWNGIRLFFRDRYLSDRIGFVYSKWNTDHAVADFISTLESRLPLLERIDSPVISIILDGENAWEYYPDGGMPFLRKLYRAIAEHPRFETTTFEDFLATDPSAYPLHRVRCGSWINSDFSTWIGDPVKNQAWSLLSRARTAVEEHFAGEEIEQHQAVMRAVAVAEGSDWFWWFGEGHTCSHEAEFDMLFRNWVTEIYRRLEIEPPAELRDPLTRATGERCSMPLFMISPQITGVVESYYKWISAGHCEYHEGALAQTKPTIHQIYFGFDESHFYLRVDLFERDAAELVAADLTIALHVRRPEAKEIELVDGENARMVEVVEAKLPLDELCQSRDTPLIFFVLVRQRGHEIERFPLYEPISLPFPTPDFGLENWSV
ncbi:MAG: hypothetical protein KC609_11855 [Myxococcales bacterium]|nr:hypothetical protein [Myxococcales bacterium]